MNCYNLIPCRVPVSSSKILLGLGQWDEDSAYVEKEWYYEVADSDGDSISDNVEEPQAT